VTRRPLTPAADPRHELPLSAAARLDHAVSAVAALEHEQSRLERIGFETPLARCHEQLRFWRFVAALHALPPSAAPACRAGRLDDAWRPAADR
jgi:hypothetical protein